MSTILLSTLIGVFCAQIAIMIIYHQNAGEKLRQMKYNYGLETLKLGKRIQALQQSVLSYHDKIDDINIKIDEYKAE